MPVSCNNITRSETEILGLAEGAICKGQRGTNFLYS
jgi:hypothetical protein